MSEQLFKAISDIQKNFQSGSFLNANEAAISQSIILRILAALSWPTTDPEIVFPEYPFEGGRVDFALCHPRSCAEVLLEVKRIGKLGGAELQLFQYAFHAGIQLAILTDGAEWHFYLPGEKGNYDKRKLCILNIASDSPNDIVSKFIRYLDYEGTCLGETLDNAREDYKSSPQKSLIANNTQKIVTTRGQMTKKSISRTHMSIRFKLYEIEYITRNRQEVIKILFNHLAEEDPSFLEKFRRLPNHGAYRKYLAKSPDELYPDQPERAIHKSYEFRPGWYIPGGLGTKTMNIIIDMVSCIKDFKRGRDIIFFDDTEGI